MQAMILAAGFGKHRALDGTGPAIEAYRRLDRPYRCLLVASHREVEHLPLVEEDGQADHRQESSKSIDILLFHWATRRLIGPPPAPLLPRGFLPDHCG